MNQAVAQLQDIFLRLKHNHLIFHYKMVRIGW